MRPRDFEPQSVHRLEGDTLVGEKEAMPQLVAKPWGRIITYLLAGAPLLALWWLLYTKLLSLSRFITHEILPFQRETHVGATIEFFIYEVPKVLLLLTLVVFVAGVIRSFFAPERTRRILAGNGNRRPTCWQDYWAW